MRRFRSKTHICATGEVDRFAGFALSRATLPCLYGGPEEPPEILSCVWIAKSLINQEFERSTANPSMYKRAAIYCYPHRESSECL